MIILNNQKGVVLITTFMVVLVLVALVGAFTARSIHEKTLVQRQDDSIKAFYNAEKGIAYAYFEGDALGWTWFTHDWNTTTNQLESNSLTSADAERTQGTDKDCHFFNTGTAEPEDGCYVADDGSFMVKTFPDPNLGSAVTVIRSKGISGTVERVLEYRISRASIFDYYMWSPYDLSFDPNWGTGTANCGGGKIHTNSDIVLHSTNWGSYGARLNGVNEISTGLNHTIRYDDHSSYGRPNWVDHHGGVSGDGIAPLLELTGDHHWIGADEANWWPYDEGWWNGYPISTDPTVWPPLDWRNTNEHFHGKPDQWNIYNTRVQIVEKDANGNVLFALGNPIILATVELPGHLSTQWSWDKYYSNPGGSEVPVQFYDFTGSVADSSYWTQLQADFPDLIDPEILDGAYGNEGENVLVTNLNTLYQDADWNNYAANPPRNTTWNPDDEAWSKFMANQALTGVIKTNDDGFELAEPKFAETYKKLAKKDGLLLDLAEHTSCADWILDNSNSAAREQCIDVSVNQWVATLNPGVINVAEKVSFINTQTGKWNTMLEIKLDNMEIEGNFPANGIIYSQIPIRITNADKLPDNTGNPTKNSFNVIAEENIYLKGTYNDPVSSSDWMPSAVISKKRIYCLSDDFNDPQVLPAMVDPLNYSGMFVADIGTVGSPLYQEVDHEGPYADSGQWVYQGYLDDDGVPDSINYYTNIPDDQQLAIRQLSEQKRTQFISTYDNPDPTGTVTAFFGWTRAGDSTEESYNWGMMPPTPSADVIYNALMAAYRMNPSKPGEFLERWYPRHRIMKGAYFRLMKAEDGGGFAAAIGDYVDLEGDLARDDRGRDPSLWHDYGHYIDCPYIDTSYDSRFVRNSSGSNKGIFFGGGPPPTWREIAIADF